ncbi:MAG: NAD(P)/FAD-dependent oxidoreductase [Rhodospirillaceae bacterium]|nr:NAD(P)/FAD-dependent oxidoreductase [Rhodospirillaceae bacterium]
MAAADLFDVAIIGGGVVGCAVARRFTLEGARTVLLERAPDILAGASKGNSALLHTGFDAPTGSLELACVRDGYAEYREICGRLGLSVLETGAAVVAWTDAEVAKLEGIVAQAHANGVDEVRAIDADELLAREPALSPAAKAAVLVPGEHVIDPWSTPLAYIRQAVENGAVLLRNAGVTAAGFDGAHWRLATTAGEVRAAAVVNCAGLWGDRVATLLLGQSAYAIHPRKGQFVVFDKAAAGLLRTTILPVPTERTKGVVVARTIYGNVLVGPTAEEQDDRERATTDSETLHQLIGQAGRIVPGLADMPVTAVYAGLRPATERKEYRIASDPDRRVIDVGGIRSTGLTAALGIARHVHGLYQAFGTAHRPIADPVWPVVPNLAEHRPRDWEAEGSGEIVCHCELVTGREIAAALTGPVPAGDWGGLKRRTRAGMGRCQGFYCTARLARLTEGRLAEPLAVGPAHHGP